jgi:hypothetical protein
MESGVHFSTPQSVLMHCSSDTRLNEASLAQYAEVVGHARFGTANAKLPAGGLGHKRQMPQDVEAHLVAKSIEDPLKGEILRGGMVIYAHSADVKRFCDTW